MSNLPVPVSEEFDPLIPPILPHAKVYLIQVGYKLFRLSGASLLSDAPSYFTAYFQQEANADLVLFIDRSPVIFEKIYNHLQGYHVNIETDYDYIYLWQDSYYFDLKRLQSYLNGEDMFATVGGQSFKMPRNLFTRTGNYPNFFLFNIDSFLSDNEALIRSKRMIRPPPQRPATASARSAQLFADILELMRGNSSVIRDDTHRRLLIKECRYFRFLELEQRIVSHKIVLNPFLKRLEIILGLPDILSRGLTNVSSGTNDPLPLEYTRPNLQNEPQRVLLVQLELTAESEVKLVLSRTNRLISVVLTNKLAQSFQLVFKKHLKELADDMADSRLVLLAGLSNSKTVINNTELKSTWSEDFLQTGEEPLAKRQKTEQKGDYMEFVLSRSIWRIIMRGTQHRLQAVHLEGSTPHQSYNQSIGFI